MPQPDEPRRRRIAVCDDALYRAILALRRAGHTVSPGRPDGHCLDGQRLDATRLIAKSRTLAKCPNGAPPATTARRHVARRRRPCS
jgi:hypothetical protein